MTAMKTSAQARKIRRQTAPTAENAANDPDLAPTPHDAIHANVSQANGTSAEAIQVVVDELVRQFGGNLRQWPDFPHVVAEAGLEPQDVTDARLAAASLHLDQRGQQFRDAVREANADPSNPFQVVRQGDPEFDPTFEQPSPIPSSEEERSMSDKKRTTKRKAKAEGEAATPKTPKAAKAKAPKAEGRGHERLRPVSCG